MTPGETTAVPRRRTWAALVALVVGLGAYDVARHELLPGDAHLATNLVAAGLVAALAWWAGCRADELGTGRDRLVPGLLWGAGAWLAVAVLVGAAALLPDARDLFADERADVSSATLAFRLLVDIPLGTVLLEELAFRGVLLALARRLVSTVPAVLATSVLFGLWHVPPALTQAAGEDASGLADALGAAGTVSGTVLATALAGVAFCWLRLRSGSLAAPALAHVATNGVSLAVAWALAR